MLANELPLPHEEQSQGSFRILSVEQRHERSGRVVLLIDAESMGETKTDFRKRQFSYQILGITETKITPSDGEASESFGEDVAISSTSNIILIGAYQDDDNGTSAGSMYV